MLTYFHVTDSKVLPNAEAVRDEDWMYKEEYADRSNKPLRMILPKRAVVDIRKHLRQSALQREMSEKYFGCPILAMRMFENENVRYISG